MAILKSPQLKKQDSYEKDHRTQMEIPHAFRKNWPKKKARANRSDRAAIRIAFAEPGMDDITANAVKKLRTKPVVFKSFVKNLRESIAYRANRRIEHSGRKNSARQRKISTES